MYKNFKNEAGKKLDPNLQKKTGLSEFTLAELYKIYIQGNINSDDLNFPQLAKVSVEQLEYWKVYISDQRVEKDKFIHYFLRFFCFGVQYSFQFLNKLKQKFNNYFLKKFLI